MRGRGWRNEGEGGGGMRGRDGGIHKGEGWRNEGEEVGVKEQSGMGWRNEGEGMEERGVEE